VEGPLWPPANWQPGGDVIVPPPATMKDADKRAEYPVKDTRCIDWFMCLRKCPK